MAGTEASRIQAIENARARRAGAASQRATEAEWFIEQVSSKVALTMQRRVRLATEFVKNQVIRNISRPVTKTQVTGKQGRNEKGQFTAGRKYTRVTDRSKKGEFPKADTTQLMKTIFSSYQTFGPGNYAGYVGTPLDYGVILETSPQFDRSFLVRTLNEERDNVMKILTGPIK